MIFRPGTMDEVIYRGVVEHNEYRLPERMYPEDVIVDVGAHIGSFSYACLMRGAGRVYCYEAERSNYELCRDNLSEFGDRVSVVRAAVWRSDEKMAQLTYVPSRDRENTGGGNVWSLGPGPSVPAASLDGVLRHAGGPDERVKLLKLDCEGSEFPALLSCAKLALVENICGEFHEFGGKYDSNVVPAQAQVGTWPYTAEALERFLGYEGFEVETQRAITPSGPCNLGHFWARRKKTL